MEKKNNNIMIILVIVVLLIILAGGVYFGYQNFQNQKKLLNAKEEIEKLEKEKEELEEKLSKLEKTEKIETEKPEEVKKENKSAQEKEVCASTLTSSDKIAIKTWKTYKNTVRKYTFKYPEDWKVYKSEKDLVGLEDKNGDIHFHIVSGDQAKGTQVPPYKQINKKEIQVACQKAQRIYFASGNDVIIRTTFEKDNVPYIVMIAYTDIGASLSSDIVEAYDLILKTIEFE